MKKYTFLSLTLIILSLLIFPAVAKADTDKVQNFNFGVSTKF